ncbi:MAG: NAD(P)/FAD-dependent oxidoreductase [Acidobacteriota bacterium]|nr:NAD(P)/FAD-dependent oxidoreductase [Acidobacteriota bacterium]
MRVAVLGGGPAGAFTAERLAAAGVSTVLLDERLAWEKPCGGGLTYKAYRQYPFLVETGTPKKFITHTRLGAPGAAQVSLTLDRPVVIYSRKELNGMLLDRAAGAGVQIEKTRLLSVARSGKGWRVQTREGTLTTDFIVVATGARNPLRDLATALKAEDAMSALGYYVPGEQNSIDIQFLAGLAGYIWVFPRCGHLSVGICGKGETASSLRKRLEGYMAERGMAFAHADFYSHLLPCLNTPAWSTNRVAGPGWLAVGDAAGLVDPITGEGLYYALRSADLAAQTILADNPSLAESAYRALLRRDFAHDLEYASRLANRIFHGKLLFGAIPTRMVQFTRRSPAFRSAIQDLFAGTQPYSGLKSRLLKNLNRSLLELAMSPVKQQ